MTSSSWTGPHDYYNLSKSPLLLRFGQFHMTTTVWTCLHDCYYELARSSWLLRFGHVALLLLVGQVFMLSTKWCVLIYWILIILWLQSMLNYLTLQFVVVVSICDDRVRNMRIYDKIRCTILLRSWVWDKSGLDVRVFIGFSNIFLSFM